MLGDTWKTKADKETADKTKKDITSKVDKVDKKISKLEYELSHNKPSDDRTSQINKEIALLNEDKGSLNKLIEGLDKMEQDIDYTYTFDSHEGTVGTKEGYTKSANGTLYPGLTKYNVTSGTNYQGQKYSAVITMNYAKFKSTGDFISDSFNTSQSKAVMAHEIIHGLQFAMRQLLIPQDPNKRNGERTESDIEGFDKETPAYKAQDAYNRH